MNIRKCHLTLSRTGILRLTSMRVKSRNFFANKSSNLSVNFHVGRYAVDKRNAHLLDISLLPYQDLVKYSALEFCRILFGRCSVHQRTWAIWCQALGPLPDSISTSRPVFRSTEDLKTAPPIGMSCMISSNMALSHCMFSRSKPGVNHSKSST